MMSQKAQKKIGWRLGGRNAPAWLQAPCDPNIKRGVRADLALLRETFSFDQMPESHPLRKLWHYQGDARVLAENRFEFHHLADDLRVVQGVPGSQALLRAMVNDTKSYADYRYELRMAGAAGRSDGQRLVRLGGKGKGADIEVITKSGHHCGIACYRAQSITPALRESPLVTLSLTKELGALVTSRPIDASIDMVIEFPIFPIGDVERRTALDAFRRVWTNLDMAQATQDGVTVSRTAARHAFSPGNWEVRITFRVPIPAREKRRLANNTKDKLAHENKQWAASYSGVPILCVEESDWSLGIEKTEIAALLPSSASHSFSGIICTWPFFADNLNGGRIRVEQADWFPRDGLGSGMNLGIATFGQNLANYREGHIVLGHNPTHAEEEWLLRLGAPPEDVAGMQVRALSLNRDMFRMPLPADGRQLTAEDLLPLVRRAFPGRPDR